MRLYEVYDSCSKFQDVQSSTLKKKPLGKAPGGHPELLEAFEAMAPGQLYSHRIFLDG